MLKEEISTQLSISLFEFHLFYPSSVWFGWRQLNSTPGNSDTIICHSPFQFSSVSSEICNIFLQEHPHLLSGKHWPETLAVSPKRETQNICKVVKANPTSLLFMPHSSFSLPLSAGHRLSSNCSKLGSFKSENC